MKRYSLIILDRDGVINEKACSADYIKCWEQFKFIPGARKAISALSKAGYKIAIASNQRGVSKGLMSEQDLKEITKKMISDVEESGGKIDSVYYCTHSKEDKCDCRKPRPGMILKALRDFQVDCRSAVMIGDAYADFEAARDARVDFIFINSNSDETEKNLERFRKEDASPITFSNLEEAVMFLVKED